MINGLVLCGGESARMGKPKALLDYHGDPQFLYTAKQLEAFCDTVYISANTDLGDSGRFTVIPDAEKYKNAGPISGVLSAIEKHPATSLLTVACDYPYLEQRDLLQLITEFDDVYEAVCFQHPQSKFPEPLIAIYHLSCFEKMKVYFESGRQSLQKFLTQIHTKMIIPKEERILRSHDTPEDFLTFRKE